MGRAGADVEEKASTIDATGEMEEYLRSTDGRWGRKKKRSRSKSRRRTREGKMDGWMDGGENWRLALLGAAGSSRVTLRPPWASD